MYILKAPTISVRRTDERRRRLAGLEPMTAPSWPSAHGVASFVFVAVASSSLAQVAQKHLGFPLITGYILSGVLAGPWALALVSRDECASLAHVINENAMGYIGFAAGAKFLLSDLRGSLKPTLLLMGSVLSATYLIVLAGVYLASPWLEITAGASRAHRLAVALLVACLSVARSPSSAIALVSELDARRIGKKTKQNKNHFFQSLRKCRTPTFAICPQFDSKKQEKARAEPESALISELDARRIDRPDVLTMYRPYASSDHLCARTHTRRLFAHMPQPMSRMYIAAMCSFST